MAVEKREILFAIFGSVICIGAALSAYFLGRSNRKFIRHEREKEKLNKGLSSQP